MKNNNLKIRPVYKVLALGALLSVAGCKETEHKNVVFGVDHSDCTTVLLVRDVDTGTERVVRACNTANRGVEYLCAGDTIAVFAGDGYDNKRMFNAKNSKITYNNDSVNIRRGRETNKMLNERFGRQR